MGTTCGVIEARGQLRLTEKAPTKALVLSEVAHEHLECDLAAPPSVLGQEDAPIAPSPIWDSMRKPARTAPVRASDGIGELSLAHRCACHKTGSGYCSSRPEPLGEKRLRDPVLAARVARDELVLDEGIEGALDARGPGSPWRRRSSPASGRPRWRATAAARVAVRLRVGGLTPPYVGVSPGCRPWNCDHVSIACASSRSSVAPRCTWSLRDG